VLGWLLGVLPVDKWVPVSLLNERCEKDPTVEGSSSTADYLARHSVVTPQLENFGVFSKLHSFKRVMKKVLVYCGPGVKSPDFRGLLTNDHLATDADLELDHDDLSARFF
jgi:hypothetical protein